MARQIYTGEFVNGKRFGAGVYLYPNGDVYQGNWQDDTKNGHGIQNLTQERTFIRTEARFFLIMQKQGNWVNGKLTGPGAIVHADHKVSGSFIDNDSLQMPVEQYFFSTGFTKLVNDYTAAGMSVPVTSQ